MIQLIQHYGKNVENFSEAMYFIQKEVGVAEESIVRVENVREYLFSLDKDMTEDEYINGINKLYDTLRVYIKVFAPDGSAGIMQNDINMYAQVYTIQDLTKTGTYKIKIIKDGELWEERGIEYNQSQRYYLTYDGGYTIGIYDTQTNSIVKADKIYEIDNGKKIELQKINDTGGLYLIGEFYPEDVITSLPKRGGLVPEKELEFIINGQSLKTRVNYITLAS